MASSRWNSTLLPILELHVSARSDLPMYLLDEKHQLLVSRDDGESIEPIDALGEVHEIACDHVHGNLFVRVHRPEGWVLLRGEPDRTFTRLAFRGLEYVTAMACRGQVVVLLHTTGEVLVSIDRGASFQPWPLHAGATAVVLRETHDGAVQVMVSVLNNNETKNTVLRSTVRSDGQPQGTERLADLPVPTPERFGDLPRHVVSLQLFDLQPDRFVAFTLRTAFLISIPYLLRS